MTSTQTSSSAAGVAWDLGVLFAGHDDPKIDASIKQLDKRAAAFAKKYRTAVNARISAPALLTALQTYEALQQDATRVAAYASLLYAADTSQDASRGLLSRVEQVRTRLQNALLFFDLAWLAVPEAAAKKLIADPRLAGYKHYLQKERTFKPHTLSEAEEKLDNEKSLTGVGAWQKLHTEFNSALRFRVLLRHPDRVVRERAWASFYGELNRNGQVLSYIYDTRFYDHLITGRLRGYKTPEQPRHMANGIDPKAVGALMRVVERNHGMAHSYWSLKARLLGLDKLELYDQYAPLGDAQQRVSFDEARVVILDALDRFSPEFAAMSRRFFDERWIDAEPRSGKRGGAFCAGVTPDTNPYILMSYNDNLRDVMTLAHELGHGMHDLLAAGNSYFNYHPSLPVAETASVFAEMLVFDAMQSKIATPKDRLALLCGKIEDSFSTVFRQIVITRFEQLAYAARAKGRLNGKQIGELWLQANAPYYGDAVTLSAGYEWGWSYIPHMINTPFYCYAYAFGDLLVKALYGMYRREGQPFIAKYKKLLASGGGRLPREQTKALGVDINSEAFWQIGFDEMARMVADAGKLAAEVTGVAPAK
jgi:oligoendopeptidase F